MALEVDLTQERTIIVQPAQTVQKTTLTIDRIIDNYSEQKAVAWITELREPVVLWEGDAYTAIGQWTDSDVQARILELFDI